MYNVNYLFFKETVVKYREEYGTYCINGDLRLVEIEMPKNVVALCDTFTMNTVL